jgi:ADP-heptose:LPS heptosyltransferase
VTAAQRRVLVARLDADGDVLLAGPAVRAVGAHADRVTFLCGPAGREAAGLLTGVDEVLVQPAEWIAHEPDSVDRDTILRRVVELAALGVDCAIVLTSFHQSPLPLALLLRMAGVPRIGAISVDYPGSLLDVRHWIADEVHEVERSLDLVAELGYRLAPGDDCALHILRPAAGRPSRAFASDYVVVHPGASVPARAWEPERCAALVALLLDAGRRVVVTGSAGERALTAHVAGPSHPAALDLGGETSFAELAEVLAGADAVVVGNTGPAHLAAAVGTPVVSLYAPTVPAVRWRPWKVPHELIHVDVPCAGCRSRECPVPGHPCLDVAPIDVVRAVERLAGAVRVGVAA